MNSDEAGTEELRLETEVEAEDVRTEEARVLEKTRCLAAQLRSTLEARTVIDRAVGIVMSRSGVSEDEALNRLRALSQHEHAELVTVAQTLIDEAVQRSQSRND